MEPKRVQEFENLVTQLYDSAHLKLVSNAINYDHILQLFCIENKGRLALFNNPDLVFENEKAMAVGFFECIDDQQIADELFLEATAYAKSEGAKWIIGPMNGSTWENYRFSTTHTEPNFFLEPYHHLYYNKLWLTAGFREISSYSSCVVKTLETFEKTRMESIGLKLKEAGVEIRSIQMERFEEEIEDVYQLCANAFSENFLYTPITKDDFVKKYSKIKGIIDSDLVLLAQNKAGEIVAVFFAIVDLLNKSTPTLIVKTIARNPDRCYAGITHLMGNQIIETAKMKGYQQMIHAFMHKENQSNIISTKFSGEVFREYALYALKVNH